MRHATKLLAFIAASLLLSCSKKDESSSKPQEETPTSSYWVLNGNKIIPTYYFAHIERKSFSFKTEKDGVPYASCTISFTDSLLKSGEYMVGKLVSPSREAQILAYIEPAGTDSVFHSQDTEIVKLKVIITPDKKTIIEIPELWVKNPHTQDSCKLSGTLIQADTTL